jgi:hypothetical protein
LGWAARRTIQDAARDLVAAFAAGRVPDSLTDPRYFNVELMRSLHMS